MLLLPVDAFPLSKVSVPSPSRLLTPLLQGSPQPGVGHKIKVPVQPLRGPWDKYSPQEVEETNSTRRKSRQSATKRGLVKWHIRRPLPKTGGQ